MHTLFDDLSVCTDCALIIANGETGQGEDYDTRVIVAQVDQWGANAGHMVLTSDDEWFAWEACDGCGSTLGGDRHAAAILAD